MTRRFDKTKPSVPSFTPPPAPTPLPARPNLEFLKKRAKQHLAALRAQEPKARLADAQLAVAREHGFASWRALHEHVRHVTESADARASVSEEQVAMLFDAIGRRDVGAVRSMLKATPLLANVPDASGQSPLHAAAEHNSAEIVELLLSAGADPAARFGNSAHTPLSWALTTNAFNAADALTKAGVKPDLFCAAGLGDLFAVKSFFDGDGELRPGASETGSSRFAPDGQPLPRPPTTPREVISDALYIASRNGQPKVVRELLDRGADVSFRAYCGGTALHWAHFGGSREAIAMLLAAGADAGARDDVFRGTPRAFGICVPASWGIMGHLKRQLRDDPTLVNVFDGRGTPLHEAARGGQMGIARVLLAAGANRHARDGDGKTPAELAQESKHDDLAKLIETAETVRPFDLASMRARFESAAIIERRFDHVGQAPRWESIGISSPKLLERVADAAIIQRDQTGLYRMVSVWVHATVTSSPRVLAVDGSHQPTRELEFYRDGEVDVRPHGGVWRRIQWDPMNPNWTGRAGRTEDLTEALKYLRDHAPAGEYRVISVRRMLRADRTKSGMRVIKKHAGSEWACHGSQP